MGDMGDMFRAWEDDKRLERQERLKIAHASDLPGWTKHTQWHWSRLLAGQQLNWWPSTAKWSWGRKGRKQAIFHGKQDDLLNFIQNRETEISVKIRVVLHGKVEVFDHKISVNPTQADLEAAVDHFESQVGTVLSIDGPNGTLFKSAVDAWEAGAN